MSGKLIVVAGAQYGSEGKGAVADQLTRPGREPGTVIGVRVAGPNAGHTVIGRCPIGCEGKPEDHAWSDYTPAPDRHRWKLRSVPVAAVSNPTAWLVIAPGSEVDQDVLASEVNALDSAGYNASGRLLVDKSATILSPHHIKTEQESDLVKRLGSTAKGIGAARADRVWRTAELFGGHVETVPYLYDMLHDGATVLIEGTQGYGLGTHAGNYPQCTSSDCRAIDFLAMAGLSPWHPTVAEFQVWLAARVRPIRVAGNSGPLKGETTWSDLGLPEERTTVTNKVRRVGEWDGELVRNAVQENGGNSVNLALTMADSLFPSIAGLDQMYALGDMLKVVDYVTHVSNEVGAPVYFIGTGPDTGIFAS